MAQHIVVEEYNPVWADMYLDEAELIRSILGDNLVEIYHIGSTSVVGLCAKPIIDIMPIVKSLERVDEVASSFEAIGYEYMGEFGIEGRRYMRKGADERTHQIHIFLNSDLYNINRHLAFRNYIEKHPDVMNQYAELKKKLAQKYPYDIEGYCEGKEAFIKSIEYRAMHDKNVIFMLTAINAKYIHSNPAVYSLRAYVGEELAQYVDIGEYTINHAFTDILADIYIRNPDVIGFSCYIWNIEMVLTIVTELKKLLPKLDIWLGGPEVSYDAPGLLQKYPMLTGIIIGEGEATFKELLLYYANGQSGSLTEIKGLYLRTGYTTLRPITNMDELPFLYDNLKDFENRIIYYETSRGCPFRCSYCLSSIDRQVRLRNIDIVKRELQFFLDNKVKQVKLVDRTFNCNHEHAMEIWRYIMEHDNGITNFHFEISADILTDDEISLLNKMRPGLVQLEIGVQTTNNDTLRAINRSMNIDRLERIVALIHAGRNVHLHLDLIAGLPYEDYTSFGRSFDRVYSMKPEQLQLGFLKVLKGSEMCEKAGEYGICYMDKPPYEVLYTKWLTYEDVLKLKRIEEMVELYYNSSQFTYTLRFLEKLFVSPFKMYEALARFYEEKGYFVNSPSRGYRYNVLLEFAACCNADYMDAYKELLLYDMYLRENLKSRPEFAGKLENYKEQIREFYRREDTDRKYLKAYGEYDSKQMSRMTHLEPFYYPVWDMPDDGIVKPANEPVFILFDYKERCPLTKEAKSIRICIYNNENMPE